MEKLGVGWEEKSVSVSSLNYNLLYRFNFYDHVMFYILKNKMTEMRNEKMDYKMISLMLLTAVQFLLIWSCTLVILSEGRSWSHFFSCSQPSMDSL